MTTLQIRIDDGLRDNAASVAKQMGIDLSSAVRMFLSQMVLENGLPFKPSADPFYRPENQAALRASRDQLSAGKTITRSLDQLLMMEK